MIDYITGLVTHARSQEITINSGFLGIAVQVPDENQFALGASATVFCHMHWNTENGPSLFGFMTDVDRVVFRAVISCSGIGPKIALAILADIGAQPFLTAIASQNDTILSKVNGIGKKKAEQIIVQLKHKVLQLIESGTILDQTIEVTHWADLLAALQSLNYSRQEIARAMDHLKKNVSIQESSFDYLLRQALSYLSKQM